MARGGRFNGSSTDVVICLSHRRTVNVKYVTQAPDDEIGGRFVECLCKYFLNASSVQVLEAFLKALKPHS